ncbi:enoyl-CoA hydratase/isomerase family protein [Rhizobium sp. Leaf321]|uniref:enoyl-CoA hydratase/isomerase family protein n=1 Tax=Rhizobium sp. Leaf321 TaxID=1736335 RepID=UPI000AAA857D|nr:enoyl-CoA hydratase/isomerase family protein [Rhizobium sp. Leaf321]
MANPVQPATEAEVLFSRRGSAAVVSLNRPKALNSLNLSMVRALDEILDRCAADPEISCVIIRGEGERGLCAGGDIRAIHQAGRASDPEVTRFWREEMPFNYRISRYEKPYVALMDGIVMGGGVGISAHGSHRIVTERTKLAMPETGIGYVPDVGATWLLPRAPGEAGTWMGLTGDVVDGADAIHAGLADSFVPSEKLDDLVAAIGQLPGGSEAEAIQAVIDGFTVSAEGGRLAQNRDVIDRTFAHDTVEEILAALSRETGEFAARTLETLSKRSPTSLKLTLKLLRLGRDSSSLVECLEREFTAACELLKHHDFYEGVRAAVIDKDRNPRWQPASLAEVTEADLAPYLAADHPVLFADHRL